MGGESTNRGGWGPPPSHSGRKPMERSFQDAILREERSRKNWVSAWGNMEEGVAKKAVGPASSPFDLDRAARLNLRNVYRVPSMSGHHNTNPGTYFTTNYPLVSSALIGQTSFELKKRQTAKSKRWAERHVANSETRRSMDYGWAHEAGVKVQKGGAVPPPRDSLKSLGNDKPAQLSNKRQSVGYPRGSRASTFHEPLNAPPSELVTTVDLTEIMNSRDPRTPSKPSSAAARSPTGTGPRSSTASRRSAELSLLKTVPRSDPRVGYVASIWAATGQGLAAAIPELPQVTEKVRPVQSTFTGWTLDGPVAYERSRSQVLSGITRHRKVASEFNIFQAY